MLNYYSITIHGMNFIWRLFAVVCMLSILSSTNVWADESSTKVNDGNSDPIGEQLCKIVGKLQGNTAKAIGTIGIFAAAVGFLSGKLQWQTVLVLAVGIMVIFGAGDIVKFLSGDKAASVCGTP